MLLAFLLIGADAGSAAIDSAMARSIAGWNAGDIDRFLQIYSDGPDTSFVAGEGLVRGKAAMKVRYQTRYDFADPAKRGTLTIERLDYRPLGRDYALYIGRYTLRYPDGHTASGPTSVVLHHEAGGWKIVADHSS
ncbi:SgcJ/EcaC family oxidoreductase [uncultured Sphingomonas sp.]|uniref:YybH family protein n=1 Tax=uncultured Sphingomonas sp. TaxID=158754 RepID=UPI0025DCA7D7|nr:SgcJ/EcaC family oxidoreductase [uncultured Sphingomonas sp.]